MNNNTSPGAEYQAQIELLESAGIVLNKEYTVQDVVEVLAEIEAEGYFEVLGTMGDTEAPGPNHYFSDSVCYIDTECIYDESDYANIAERLMRLTSPDLPLQNVKSGKAWLSFEFKGDPYRWDFEEQDDWMDETLISKLGELTRENGATRRFAIAEGGQDFLLVYIDQEHLDRLEEITRLGWKWSQLG